MKKAIFIFLILLFQSCAKQEQIPREINIGFEYFNKNWNSEDIEKLKNVTEEITIPRNFNYGIPADIKNNLLRNNKNSQTLTKFFNSLGIKEYDDMAGILLISYQKHLNGQTINLSEQVKSSKAYWKPILECQEQQTVRRLELYYGKEINDTINVRMPVSENNSVVDYICPNLDWEFRPSTDLSIDGLITNKLIGMDSTDMILKVRVLAKNHPSTEIMMLEVNVGDEFEISLNETAWKIKTNGNNVYN